jgi:hypothetical protein
MPAPGDGNDIDLAMARSFLTGHYGVDPATVALIGEGAWSRCFAFGRGGAARVIRFGRYRDDFVCDARAHAFAGPDLPIPEVFEIGDAFGGYYAVSTRVEGVPLERVDARTWAATAPNAAGPTICSPWPTIGPVPGPTAGGSASTPNPRRPSSSPTATRPCRER